MNNTFNSITLYKEKYGFEPSILDIDFHFDIKIINELKYEILFQKKTYNSDNEYLGSTDMLLYEYENMTLLELTRVIATKDAVTMRILTRPSKIGNCEFLINQLIKKYKK